MKTDCLYKILGCLHNREAEIIRLRFGMGGNKPRTLEEVGILMGGVSRERIRQIENKAFRRIKYGCKDFRRELPLFSREEQDVLNYKLFLDTVLVESDYRERKIRESM